MHDAISKFSVLGFDGNGHKVYTGRYLPPMLHTVKH